MALVDDVISLAKFCDEINNDATTDDSIVLLSIAPSEVSVCSVFSVDTSVVSVNRTFAFHSLYFERANTGE